MNNSLLQSAVSNNSKSAYRKIRPLGEGTFGKVFLVQEFSTKIHYVSKEIKLTNLDVSSVVANRDPVVHRGEDTRGAEASAHHQPQRLLQNPLQ